MSSEITPTIVNDDALRASLLLSMVSGVGPRIYQQLLEYFGTSTAALHAPISELCKVAGVGAKLSKSISAARHEIDVDSELRACRENGVQLLSIDDPSYPRMLREIVDPPSVLYVAGGILPHDNMSIGIVGSRHATQYGLQQADRLAAGLSRAGLTIVSGMARGIDAAAHRGALNAGGRTIAVLGSGLLNIYPPEHKELSVDIADNGALISESPVHRGPFAGAFPQRNRLITGFSLGVIVVEASERSGALISARHAMEQNREVFAVPGRIDSRMSRGCHQLIRDGAKLVQDIDDVLEEFGPLVEQMSSPDGRSVRNPAELKLNEQERQVLDAITTAPISLDDVAQASGLPVHRVLSTISVLEMKHLVGRISGNQVARR